MSQYILDDSSPLYGRLVNDIAARVAEHITQAAVQPYMVSQREAYRLYGRSNVERWLRQGLITAHKRPGKVEYYTADLRRLADRQQDYFNTPPNTHHS